MEVPSALLVLTQSELEANPLTPSVLPANACPEGNGHATSPTSPRCHFRLHTRSWSLAERKGITREKRVHLASKKHFSDTTSLAAQLRTNHSPADASATKPRIAAANLALAPRPARASGASPPAARRRGPLAATARPQRDALPVAGPQAGLCHQQTRSHRAPIRRGR